MQSALHGLIVGFGLGALLLLFEFVMLNKAVNERAKKYNRKPEFDVTDRRRMHSILRFALVLPIGFAAAFWLLWG
ncbi:MAG TPA: hypothetical protein VM183_06090 [Burkholderiales bacterium]|nr:hypothetical protein [Burkholderiales bacterium]